MIKIPPKVIGNKEFFKVHTPLYERVLDGRCPICNSTITNLDTAHPKFVESGLCKICAKHYGNNLGRALRSYEHELWINKASEHADRRDSGISKTTNKKLPYLLGRSGGKIYPPKIEPSYVIENRESSRPPAPKYTPKSVSEQKVRKYLADKKAGVV